jgi:hypothetical protein
MDKERLWTPADDETTRDAFDTLRWETDALPLADVRFIKARGNSRRRRAFVAGTAAAAAAVAVVGVLGFVALGRNQALDLSPAAPNTTATSSPTPLLVGGPLPVSVEWQRALGTTQRVRIVDMRPGEGVFADCPVAAPGEPIKTSSFNAVPSGPNAAQGFYRANTANAGETAATTAVNQLVGCQVMKVKVEADATWPKVFSSHTTDSHNWYVVAHQGPLTSLITVNTSGSPAPHPALVDIQALAAIAQQRLVQEVQHGSATPLRPSVPATS